MDTITQITLGAAVGEAVLGKKIGNKAPAIGAFFGVLPDLDILANPFANEVQELVIHRGLTHSVFFSVVAAPFFGWLFYRWFQKTKEPPAWREWSLLIFLVIITHIFIDTCTGYGTQVFQPFSNYPLSFNTIFIIDPFYTLPLLAGLLTALFMKRNTAKRSWANYLGLGISSLYLVSGFAIKSHVNHVFENNFQQQQIAVDEYITTPMPFTQFLWVSYARSGDTIHAGLYSLFDEDRIVELHRIERNTHLIEPYLEDLPVERILWFSRGYYVAEQHDDALYLHDLRFGRTDLWLTEGPATYVWNFRLEFNQDSTAIVNFAQPEPDFDFSDEHFRKLTDRILDLK